MVPYESMITEFNSKGLAIDLNVGGVATPIDNFLDELINWTVANCGIEEFVSAKEEFFSLTGKVFHDDDNFHNRMHYFLSHLMFERPIQAFHKGIVRNTPFEEYLSRHSNGLIGGYTHSLFRVLRQNPSGLMLEDVMSKQRYRISRQTEETHEGINKGDYFQGFIFHTQELSVLGRGLIFHPKRTYTLLVQSIQASKKSGQWEKSNMLNRFASLQLKHSRLKHVDPKLIYSEKSS